MNARGTRSDECGGQVPGLRALASAGRRFSSLASGLRTRTANRAPAPILQGRDATTRRKNQRVLTDHSPGDTGLPGLLREIEGRNTNRDGSETKNEQRKCGKQFAHRINLQRGD